MMIDFTGYTELGSLDLSDEAYGSDRNLAVYVRDADGALFTLDASGCSCCSDLYDGLTVADLEPVAAQELAGMLLKEMNENGGETPEGRIETEKEFRTIMQGVAAAAPGPLAIEP